MKKNVFGRQFSRDKNERTALFKGLMSGLILNERIKTTQEKAKAIRPSIEKAITKAIKYGEAAKRLLGGELLPDALEKLVKDVAPRFKNRPGGYTRIVKIGRRFGDDAMEAYIELVDGPAPIIKTAGSLKPRSKIKKSKPKKSVSLKKKTLSKVSVKKSKKGE